MENIINYINTAPAQATGKIIFLLALALILGSSMLAFISELTHKPSARVNYPVRSHNITGSTWLWIIIFSLIGGTSVYLPQTATIMHSTNPLIVGLSAGIALLLFLLYHFTSKIIKIKTLHAPLALIAACASLTAVVFWYLPATYESWMNFKKVSVSNNELIAWCLSQEQVAYFIHFLLNSIAIAALFFMLSNATEKEKKRKQPRDYYFKASGFAGSWLFAVVTLQIIPLGWLIYNFSTNNPKVLFTPQEVYWFAGIVTSALCGWLLLIKINKDALVNYRATFIIALFFIISLNLFHFGPLGTTTTTPISSESRVEKKHLLTLPPQPDKQTKSHTQAAAPVKKALLMKKTAVEEAKK